MKMSYSHYENYAKWIVDYAEIVRASHPEEADGIIAGAILASSIWDVDDSEKTRILAVLKGKIK